MHLRYLGVRKCRDTTTEFTGCGMLQHCQRSSLLRGITWHLPSRDSVALLCYHVGSPPMCPIASEWLMQGRLQPASIRHLLPPSHLSNLAYRIRILGGRWPDL
jgi:hypothetical protein